MYIYIYIHTYIQEEFGDWGLEIEFWHAGLLVSENGACQDVWGMPGHYAVVGITSGVF